MGKRVSPFLRMPRAIARATSSSVQLPIPVAESGVILEENNTPNLGYPTPPIPLVSSLMGPENLVKSRWE